MDLNSPEVWQWIWLVAAACFAIGEIVLAGSFFFFPFAMGAGAAAGVAFLGGGTGVSWAVFVGVSVVSMLALRPLARRLDRAPNASIGSNRWASRQGRVTQDIPAGGTGRVLMDGEDWRAESLMGFAIPAGSTVLVSRVEGTRLLVLPLDDLGLGEADAPSTDNP